MQTLAAVLELKGELAEALALLRSALRLRPDFADARYLLGKILLAQGSTPEALEHLQAAARLAPEDANVHFQLAQAYEKAGRRELAQQEFARYRELKDKKREGSR
jgi:Flp pilus assembly protein TadD